MLKDDRAAAIHGAKTRLLEVFRDSCADHGLCAEDARLVLKGFNAESLSDILPKLSSMPTPAEPPERWCDRVGRKDNPLTFIRRVYADYLHGGLTRATLRKLDPLLYQALAVWECRHPDDQLNEWPKRIHRLRNTVSGPSNK
jgi:hypothetical protein